MVLEKTLESPLDFEEIQPVNPKGDQSFIERTDVMNWLIGKDPDAGKDWGQEEKGTIEEGCLASPTQWTWVWASSGSWWQMDREAWRAGSPWGGKELDMTEWLNWTELSQKITNF